MKNEEIRNELNSGRKEKSISRRDAIHKMGYAAFASSTMFLLLNNPTKAQSSSPITDPGDFPNKSGEFDNPYKQPAQDEWNTDEDPWK